MRVKHRKGLGSLSVEADATGLVSRSGTALVSELAARLDLGDCLSAGLSRLHRRRPLHAPGRVVCDLATMLIDGGDCVLDLGGARRSARPVRGGGLALDGLAFVACNR